VFLLNLSRRTHLFTAGILLIFLLFLTRSLPSS